MTAAPKLDLNFLMPFIEGTLHTLQVSCATQTKSLNAMLKGDTNHKKYNVPIDIASIISISSHYYKGNVALCMPETLFLTLMTRMLGEEFTVLSAEIEDGAGELLNMIFGHAKKILNENGHSFEKALPTIVRAPNLALNHTGTKVSLIVPFEADAGPFFLEINVELK